MLMPIFAKEGAMLWTSGPLQQQVANSSVNSEEHDPYA